MNGVGSPGNAMKRYMRISHRATVPVVLAISTLSVMMSLAPGTAHGQSLAYVRASSQLAKQKNIAAYHPIHVLDDDPNTVWCEGDPELGEGQELRLFFKKPQKIDRVVLTAAGVSGRLVRKIQLSDGLNSVEIDLDHQVVEQSLNPPMRGERYTITITEVGAASPSGKLPANVACLADVILFRGKRPFGGNIAPSQLRYNKLRDKLLGRWAGGPLGAPEKFFTFAMDGTWRWLYQPILGGKSRRLSGEYRFRGKRLLMRKGETGRWADVRFKHSLVKVDPEQDPIEGDYEVISFNAAVNERLSGDYNNAEF